MDEYFDFYFQFHPTEGTQAGLHQYDAKLEDFSRAGIDAEVAGLVQFQKKFNSIPGSQLSQESVGDLEVLTSSIQARLLELQSIQMWRKDPDVYVSNLSYSVFLIMRRNFAPQADRLRSVVAREREIPRVLEAARENVSNPPRVYTKWPCSRCRTTSSSFKMMFRRRFGKCRIPSCWPSSKQATMRPSKP